MKKYIFIIISFIFFAVSCTERIDFDLSKGRNNKPVIKALFTNENTIQTVTITRSTDYYQESPVKPELGAQVSISDGTNTIAFFDPDNNGVYETQNPVAGVPGTTYNLLVKLTDNTEYTAQSTMNSIAPFDSVRYEYREEYTFEGVKKYFYVLSMYAWEPETPGNIYMMEYAINDTLETDTLKEKIFTDDKFVNGNYIDHLQLFYIENDRIKEPTADVQLRMYSIPKDYYNFLTAVIYETQMSGNPFAGPPANLPTNLSGDALGFFTAAGVTTMNMTIVKGVNPDYWDTK